MFADHDVSHPSCTAELAPGWLRNPGAVVRTFSSRSPIGSRQAMSQILGSDILRASGRAPHSSHSDDAVAWVKAFSGQDWSPREPSSVLAHDHPRIPRVSRSSPLLGMLGLARRVGLGNLVCFPSMAFTMIEFLGPLEARTYPSPCFEPSAYSIFNGTQKPQPLFQEVWANQPAAAMVCSASPDRRCLNVVSRFRGLQVSFRTVDDSSPGLLMFRSLQSLPNAVADAAYLNPPCTCRELFMPAGFLDIL